MPTCAAYGQEYLQQPLVSAEADKAAQARLLSGRALALEGDADFKNALADYARCQDMNLKLGCACCHLALYQQYIDGTAIIT